MTDGKVGRRATGDYGPLPVMMSNLLGVAQTGGLDGLLSSTGASTRPTTRSRCSSWATAPSSPAAADAHLTGSQWGMMNETGQYPGQTWLWLYTMWYQVSPFNSGAERRPRDHHPDDVLTVALALVPFIPILRDIPRWIPIHRLIWRKYYRGGW